MDIRRCPKQIERRGFFKQTKLQKEDALNKVMKEECPKQTDGRGTP